jgi:hypothetical protein
MHWGNIIMASNFLRSGGCLGAISLAICTATLAPARAERLGGQASYLLQDEDSCWRKEWFNEGTRTWSRGPLEGFLVGGNYLVERENTEPGDRHSSLRTGPGDAAVITRVSSNPHEFNQYTYRLVRMPCPPRRPYRDLDFYLGIIFSKANLRLDATEALAATGQKTFDSSDRHDPLGAGIIVGAKFRPFSNSVVVSPFASIEYLNMSVNHYFPGGSFYGTTSNFSATGGVKAGPELFSGLWLYGIAGISVLNETLNINFIPVASSSTTSVPGATVGAGFAFQPSFLQNFGRPISLFAEYQHTWWQDAQFNRPAASPLFNYNFHREDDVVKVGFTVSLNAPPVITNPSMPTKAPALK